MRPDEVCGLLAEKDRLLAFAAVVLGAGSAAEVTAATGLAARGAIPALRRLEDGGLVETVEGRWVAVDGAFKEAVRAHAPAREPGEPLDPDQAKAAVLRAFVKDGRLVTIPAAQSKRYVILEHLAASFEPGVRYPEKEVDAVLRAWHDDYASLRRYLVEAGLMSRDHGMYWRSGGRVEI